MPIQLREDREYPRLEHTKTESRILTSNGFTPVVSSNVSAIAKDKTGLLVRFHGGATYNYPRSGDLFQEMLDAPSKGKFVWEELIRKNVPYQRVGNIRLAEDVPSRDMMLPKQQEPSGKSILAALALTTMVLNEEALTKGIIAGALLATMINGNATKNAA